MNHSRTITTITLAALMALGLAACDRADERTAGQQVDAAVAKTEAGAERVGEAAKEATAEAKAAVSDAAITASVNAELARDNELSALRIDVDTQSGRVALKGTAPSAAAKERAESLARAVDGVTAVDNQLEVRG
jgi:osmotically-inducible protein OsmY